MMLTVLSKESARYIMSAIAAMDTGFTKSPESFLK